MLKPIDQKADNWSLEDDGFLAGSRQCFDAFACGLVRSFLEPADFDEWECFSRLHIVDGDESFLMFEGAGNLIDRQARCIRCED